MSGPGNPTRLALVVASVADDTLPAQQDLPHPACPDVSVFFSWEGSIMSRSALPYTLRTHSDVLGLLPYLLGYHPTDSVVALYTDADRRMQAGARADLSTPTAQIISHLSELAANLQADTVMLVGYGPRSARNTIIDIATALAATARVVRPLMVADGQRFCLEPGCDCPAVDGVAFDPTASRIAAQSAMHGLVALPSRADLLALVGSDRAAQANTQAAMPAPDQVVPAGGRALRSLMDQAKGGERLTDGQVAHLAIILTARPIRDAAWLATTDHMWQRDLWLDVTRRVPGAYVTAPATLAAWCTWLRGEETLALAATSRALKVDPKHTLALLIVAGIRARIPAHDIVGTWPATVTDPTATPERS
jgi:hypothetical protein